MSELTTQDACVTGSAPIAPEKINGKINLLDLTRKEMRQFFADMGEKPFRADQVMKWIYHYCYDDFDLMTDINKVLRTKLKAVAEIRAGSVRRTALCGRHHQVGYPCRRPGSGNRLYPGR